MTKVNTATATEHIELAGVTGHYAAAGGYTIGFESYSADDDPAPLFAGLPGDRCQCPHWGVVLEGKLIFNYADGAQDVIEAGEAYYAEPGHLPVFIAGTRVVEFSPTEDLERTMAVVVANIAAMQAG